MNNTTLNNSSDFMEVDNETNDFMIMSESMSLKIIPHKTNNNKRLYNEFCQEDNMCIAQKKRKITQVIKVQFEEKILVHILSFVNGTEENTVNCNLVSQSWYNIIRRNLCFLDVDNIQKMSKTLLAESIFWESNKQVKKVTALMKQKKAKEGIKVLQNIIPLRDYLLGCETPDTYYVDNIFEYLLLKYGSELHKPTIAKLAGNNSFTKPMNLLVYSLTETKTYVFCTQVVDKLVEKYNPISVFARTEKIECLKVIKDLSKLYYATYECLKLSYKLKDIAKCFRTFAFYFIEVDKLESAIACLLKSTQFDAHISVLQEINHIQKFVLSVKLSNLDKEEERLGESAEIDEKRKHLKYLHQFCETAKLNIIDFMCKNELIPINKKLATCFPSIIRNNISITNAVVVPRIRTKQAHININEVPTTTQVQPQIEMQRNQPVNINYVSSLTVPTKRTMFPGYTCSNEEMRFMEKHLPQCQMESLHRKKDDTTEMPLTISKRIIYFYDVLIRMQEKSHKDNEQFIMELQMTPNKKDKLSKEDIERLGYLWNTSSFFTLNELKHIHSILLKSEQTSNIESMNDLLC